MKARENWYQAHGIGSCPHSNTYKLQGQLRLYKTSLFLCFVFSSIKKAKEKKFKAFDNKCQVLSEMTYVFAHLMFHIIIQLSIYGFIHNIKINEYTTIFPYSRCLNKVTKYLNLGVNSIRKHHIHSISLSEIDYL